METANDRLIADIVETTRNAVLEEQQRSFTLQPGG